MNGTSPEHMISLEAIVEESHVEAAAAGPIFIGGAKGTASVGVSESESR